MANGLKFHPERSSTFRKMHHSGSTSSSALPASIQFSQQYIDGSQLYGYLATDIVQLGPHYTRSQIGCIERSVNFEGYDGILGLGFSSVAPLQHRLDPTHSDGSQSQHSVDANSFFDALTDNHVITAVHKDNQQHNQQTTQNKLPSLHTDSSPSPSPSPSPNKQSNPSIIDRWNLDVHQEKLSKRIFAILLNEDNGEIQLGGYFPRSIAKGSTIVHAAVIPECLVPNQCWFTSYRIHIDGIRFGKTDLLHFSDNVKPVDRKPMEGIVDSGTSCLILPSGRMNNTLSESPWYRFASAVAMYPFLDDQQPSIFIKISGHEFEIPYSQYMRAATQEQKQSNPNAELTMCVDSIAEESHYLSDTLILGDVFLRTVLTIHDLTNPQVPSIGFAKRNPNYIPGKFYKDDDDDDDDDDSNDQGNTNNDNGKPQDGNNHDNDQVPPSDNTAPQPSDPSSDQSPSDQHSTSKSPGSRSPLAIAIPMRKTSVNLADSPDIPSIPNRFKSLAFQNSKLAKASSSMVTKTPSRIHYTVDISVGTPRQSPLSVIIDTGSSTVAIFVEKSELIPLSTVFLVIGSITAAGIIIAIVIQHILKRFRSPNPETDPEAGKSPQITSNGPKPTSMPFSLDSGARSIKRKFSTTHTAKSKSK